MKEPTVVIRKYGNRRLYDTAASRYVNLDDIAAFIRQGKEVQILDAKTGSDLTRVTLTQIITEDAKNKPTGLPLELLRQLVVASDEVRQEFIMWYLKSAFDTYQKVQDAVQSRLGEVQSAIFSPLEAMQRVLAPVSGSTQSSSQNESNSEIAALRRRVAELELEAERKKDKRKKKHNRHRVTSRR